MGTRRSRNRRERHHSWCCSPRFAHRGIRGETFGRKGRWHFPFPHSAQFAFSKTDLRIAKYRDCFNFNQNMEKRFFNGPPTPEEFQRQLQEFMRQHFAGAPQPRSDLAGEADGTEEQTKTESFSFDKKPRDVKAYLDRFVIKQEEAKKVLSVALCDHYQHVRLAMEGKDQSNYAKQNVILPTPVGPSKMTFCLA